MYKHFQLIIDMKSDVYNFIEEKICNIYVYVYIKWMIVHKKVGLQGGCCGMLCADAIHGLYGRVRTTARLKYRLVRLHTSNLKSSDANV